MWSTGEHGLLMLKSLGDEVGSTDKSQVLASGPGRVRSASPGCKQIVLPSWLKGKVIIVLMCRQDTQMDKGLFPEAPQ